MPIYAYKARDGSGKPVKGTIDAASKNDVVDKLHKMGYMATHVSESIAAAKIGSFLDSFKMIGAEDMILFNVQLSNMINAGINILTCMDTMGRQVSNKRLRDAIGDIKRNVEAGSSLSEAMARHPRIFSGLYVNMIKAGEASGKLDKVLARYADYYEHQADLREKVKSALFYPGILLAFGLAVTLFIVTFVIPEFAKIFMKSGITLPLVTLVLYKIGIGLKEYWYIALAGIAGIWLMVRAYALTPAGRLNLDKMKLRFPVIGGLQRKAAISRFSRTLSTLVASGVSILISLDIVKRVVDNKVLANVIADVQSTVERGEGIAQHLKISGEFPPDIVQMIAVGEETGGLDEMLNKVSDFYDMSLGYTIKRLTAIIEPFFLLIMGSMIGFIMASMLLPIFDMIKMLRH
jgi:type IV pilus assembly protein PilC